jgi:hypothetical protein
MAPADYRQPAAMASTRIYGVDERPAAPSIKVLGRSAIARAMHQAPRSSSAA